MARQTCADFELLVRAQERIPALPGGPAIRRIPAALAQTAADALTDGLRAARGTLVLVTAGTGSALLEDRGLIEKLARLVFTRPGLAGVVLADAGEAGRYPLRLLAPEEVDGLEPNAVLLNRPALAGEA